MYNQPPFSKINSTPFPTPQSPHSLAGAKVIESHLPPRKPCTAAFRVGLYLWRTINAAPRIILYSHKLNRLMDSNLSGWSFASFSEKSTNGERIPWGPGKCSTFLQTALYLSVGVRADKGLSSHADPDEIRRVLVFPLRRKRSRPGVVTRGKYIVSKVIY